MFSLQGSPPFLKLDFGLCARVSQRFSFPLSPRSNFPPGQRFLLPNHMTSGCMSPRSPFSTWSAVSPSKSHDFRLYEPAIPFFPWSAVSPPTFGHDVTRPIRSQSGGHLGALYYYRTAKQKLTNKENLVRFLHRGKPTIFASSLSIQIIS